MDKVKSITQKVASAMEKVKSVMTNPKSVTDLIRKFTTKTKSVTTLMRNIGDFAKDAMDKETEDAEKIVGIIFA